MTLDVQQPAPAERTVPANTDPANTDPANEAAITAVAENLSYLVQTYNRQRAASSPGDQAEWMIRRLLFHVARCEPIRLGALAVSLDADPSTVSRQVTTLVKDGLIERRADSGDGRASLLALSEAGHQLHQQMVRHRNDVFESILSDWTVAERRQFGDLLGRYLADVDVYRSQTDGRTAPTRSSSNEVESE